MADNQNIRETTADWISYRDGEVKTEKIRVLYLAQTVRQIKAARAEYEALEKDGTNFLYYSDTLVRRLNGLPDVAEAPAEITLEWLEEQDVKNLKFLDDAIKDADNPKSPAVRSPAGSAARKAAKLRPKR